MHRFYLPPEEVIGTQFRLRAGDAHHARHVVRIRPGDPVTILDGAGQEHWCIVEGESRTEILLRKVETRRFPALRWRITVYQAVTKTRSMDLVMQKATELGAWRIVPVLTERSVPHFGGDEAGRKTDRWRDLAIEAVKQCGNPWLPRIEEPIPFARALAGMEPPDLAVVASLRSTARHPREPLQRFRSDRRRDPVTVAVWVGPEGDFTTAELDALESAGVLPITLGPLVLRAETATLYCLSALSYELQAGHPDAVQASNSH